MMVLPSVADLPTTRILFLTRYASEEPAYVCRSFPGDGGSGAIGLAASQWGQQSRVGAGS